MIIVHVYKSSISTPVINIRRSGRKHLCCLLASHGARQQDLQGDQLPHLSTHSKVQGHCLCSTVLFHRVGCTIFSSNFFCFEAKQSKKEPFCMHFGLFNWKILFNFFASFCFRLFASNESKEKGHIFSLCFASLTFFFTSCSPVRF
jgi:hypothetical protein